MFKIVSLANGYQIDAEDKDALFSELESANARAKDKSETVELKVYQVGDQDSILDEIDISLPFAGIIEEVLDGFGKRESKSSKFSLLNLFKHKQVEPVTDKHDPVEVTTEEKNSEDEVSVTNFDSVPDFVDDSDEEFQPVNSDTKEEIELEDSQTSLDEPLPSVAEPVHSENISNGYGVTEMPVKHVPTSQPIVKSQNQVIEKRDIVSLSTYDLQNEFVLRIESELSKIDLEMEQLATKKMEHENLLSALKQVKLS